MITSNKIRRLSVRIEIGGNINLYPFICWNFPVFDRKFIEAVLNEWQRTMVDLPAGFRQACEMVGNFTPF